jgi:hypothetical protein
MMDDDSLVDKSLWYAGRFVRRKGQFGEVDVIASQIETGWQPIEDSESRFAKFGRVEISGSAAFSLRPGDWLAFQVIRNRRPRAVPFCVSVHRRMPRYLNMPTLGSVEAARLLFTAEGWADKRQEGHWAIRFVEHCIVVVDLVRGKDDKLRVSPSSLERVPSYAFVADHVIQEPTVASFQELYDLSDPSAAAYDWSSDTDYIAHVVRSLRGEKDRRLDDLIIWLELHRDQCSGQVSATGADPEKAYEAIRSGELARRLKADKAVMGAYLSAVRDDPTIARVLSEAATQAAADERKHIAETIESELKNECERKIELLDEEIREKRRSLENEIEQSLKERRADIEREVRDKIAISKREADEQIAAIKQALAIETISLTGERDSILEEQERLRAEANGIVREIAELNERRRLAQDEMSRLSSSISALSRTKEKSQSGTIIRLPDAGDLSSVPITVEALASEISRAALLTAHGKSLMEEFAVLLLAGELPVLEGQDVEDFVLIAESLMAADCLVPFDIDSTILTAEDIWSRPGSGVPSQVAQASTRAEDARITSLVQLRGIERSAARAWLPALAALTRRGLLPRRLMLFATILDPEAAEAKELPNDLCRLKIQNAIAPGASLLAPGVLSAGPGSVAFQLDPGNRARDLSPTLAIFTGLGSDVSVAMSLRLARVGLEASRLRPGNHSSALALARDMCNSESANRSNKPSEKGERRHA